MTVKKYRLLVSAGDSSGDLILSRILQELKANARPGVEFEFRGLCGPASQQEGVRVIGNTKDVSVVGLVEVLRNLGKIVGTLRKLAMELSQVDSVLCVDFPDFNFRLASMAFKASKPVDYVIAPQVWAWRSGRLTMIKKLVRMLYPALPFEEGIFREAGVKAKYLGHPMRDLLPPRNRRASRETLGYLNDDFVFAVMPGSRKSEIRRHLGLLCHAWKELLAKPRVSHHRTKNYKVVVPLAPGWTVDDIKALLPSEEKFMFSDLIDRGTWQVTQDSRLALMAADFGWITSGTATLEAAYYQLPHILLYKLNGFSVFILSQLSSYFRNPDAAAGLPNILIGKKVFPELLQDDLSAKRLAVETYELFLNANRQDIIEKNLRWIPKKLGEPGATKRIAVDLLAQWNLL